MTTSVTAIPESALTPFVRRPGNGREAHCAPSLAMTSFTWQRSPGRFALTTVAKATFALRHRQAALLLDETLPLGSPVATSNHPLSSIQTADDFAPIKVRADVIVHGHAYAPRGRASAMEIQFRFGRKPNRFERSLMVFGDRHWYTKGGVTLAISDAKPFEQMPLLYERSYGGPTHHQNPIGLGYPAPRSLAIAGAALLPNIEDPRHLIESPDDEPECAGLGAVSQWWPARQACLGRFDTSWLHQAWPSLPFDTNADYFQCAPQAQQLPLLDGNEPYELVGLHPHQPRFRGSLPGVRPACVARRSDGELIELAMQLDTVVFEPDHERLVLCWRNVMDATDADASELNDLMGVLAPLDETAETVRQICAICAVVPRGYPGVIDTPEEEAADPSTTVDTKGDPNGSEITNNSNEQKDNSNKKASNGSEIPSSGSDKSRGNNSAAAPAPRIHRGRTRAAREALAMGAPLPRELMYADLSGMDLNGVDLSWADLQHAQLSGAQMRGAKLEGARLSGANLRGCDLRRADLSNALADDCDLRDADLSEAIVHDCDMSRACAQGARFDGCRGTRLVLEEADVSDATFEGAELPSCQLLRSRIHRSRFAGAALVEVCMYQAQGREAVFSGAEMHGARMDEATLEYCDFRSVRAAGSFWTDATLTRSAFDAAELDRAQLVRAQATAAQFLGAVLRGAKLGFGQLHKTIWAKADLMNADLADASLIEADLRGANLYGCTTLRCDLAGARIDPGALQDTAAARNGTGGSP